MAGELYESEFKKDLEKALTLISEISDKTQQRSAIKWMNKILSLKSEDPQVKKNRNCFLKYYLNLLKNTVDSITVETKERSLDVLTQWSPDKRTYVAIKPLPSEGALIYMAVADDPSQGWDFPKPNETA
uniref:DUF4485 domain-containing protein n=1 Tax=Cacopsylla melanoneura TaxID=428564 RepID=A0A8D9EAG1_9HEMI